MMRVPAQIVVDTDNNTLSIVVPAADGEGDVTVLTLNMKSLTPDERRRLPKGRKP